MLQKQIIKLLSITLVLLGIISFVQCKNQEKETYSNEINNATIKKNKYAKGFDITVYDFYKVLTMQEFDNIKVLLDKIIYGYKPKPFKFNLEGASNTAKFLSEIYNES